MKQETIKYLPGFTGLMNYRTGQPFYQLDAAPAEPPVGAPPVEEAVITQLRTAMLDALAKRGYVDQTGLEAFINAKLKGVDVEALRGYDQNAMDEKIRKIAEQVERSVRSTQVGQKRDFVRETLTDNFPSLEKILRAANGDKSGSKAITLNARAAATMTLDNLITEVDIPEDILESFSLDAFVPKRYGQQYIYDIADRTVLAEITQYKTWLEEGDEQGAFAIVEEGAVKPLVSYGLVRNFAKYDKVAGKYVITEEVAKFRKEAYAIIGRLIRDKLVRDYSAIITADLNAVAVGYTGTPLDGTITMANDYDAIGAVVLQGQLVNFNIDTIVLNPADLWKMRLTKDNQGRYLFEMTTDANGATQTLGLRVIVSTYQTAGWMTLVESGLYKIEEEPITIRLGYGIDTTVAGGNVTAVSSDFDTNRQRVIVEMFFNHWLATNHIGSIIRAQFSTVIAALSAEV